MPKSKGLGARRVKPRTETVRICTDGHLVGQIRHLDGELGRAERDDATLNRTPMAPQIARRIRDLQMEADEAMVEITVQGVGDRRWRELLAEYPPTKKQIADAKSDGTKKPDHDTERFPYAAVAASITTIDGEEASESEDTVRDFFDALPQGEFARVWTATLLVNVGDNSVPFSSRASKHLTDYEPSLKSADSTG